MRWRSAKSKDTLKQSGNERVMCLAIARRLLGLHDQPIERLQQPAHRCVAHALVQQIGHLVVDVAHAQRRMDKGQEDGCQHDEHGVQDGTAQVECQRGDGQCAGKDVGARLRRNGPAEVLQLGGDGDALRGNGKQNDVGADDQSEQRENG